jgi:hypothetical protein
VLFKHSERKLPMRIVFTFRYNCAKNKKLMELGSAIEIHPRERLKTSLYFELVQAVLNCQYGLEVPFQNALVDGKWMSIYGEEFLEKFLLKPLLENLEQFESLRVFHFGAGDCIANLDIAKWLSSNGCRLGDIVSIDPTWKDPSHRIAQKAEMIKKTVKVIMTVIKIVY